MHNLYASTLSSAEKWVGGMVGVGVPILMGFVLINANIKNPIDKTAR